jgi:hypothetical protein
MPFLAIGDIISVNGKPAKGSWVDSGRLVQLFRNPAVGQAISDLAVRGGMVDIHLEILQSDGTPVGSIMTSGFTGGSAPPGLPSGLFFNQTVTGGTGAFLGMRGTLAGGIPGGTGVSFRNASMAEDPANRRINGGTRGHFTAYLIPMLRPDVVMTRGGRAIVHSRDGSQVTASNPANAGETLTLYATKLGPTRPVLEPGKAFSADPPHVANSPIDISIGGLPADVLYAGGYPGSTDGFQVNFRLPTGVKSGTHTLKLTAAFIPGSDVSIPIR